MRQMFEREGVEFGRGLSFFDAIFAFAITVLVVNIEPPPAKDWQSLGALMAGGLGNQLSCFAISFVVIAVFWRHNTQLMQRFGAMDATALSANILTAGFVVLIPFSTQGLSDPEIYGNPLPTAIYAVNVALIILTQTVTLEIGRARGLLVNDVPRAARWASRIDVLIKAGIFLASVPVAYIFGAHWGQLSWLLLIIAGRLSGGWSDRVAARASNAEAGPPPLSSQQND